MDNNDTDTYTVSISNITDKITISNDNVAADISLDPDDGVSTMLSVMGFTEATVSANSITANRLVNIGGLKNLLLKTNIGGENLIRYSGDNGKNDGFTYRVPINVPYGWTVHHRNENIHDLIYVNNLPHILEMELRTRKTTLVNTNNSDWSITFLVAHIV
jgi:hypothetical protein